MYYLVGYNLMYDGVDGGYLGSFSLFSRSSDVEQIQVMRQDLTGISKWFLLQRLL